MPSKPRTTVMLVGLPEFLCSSDLALCIEAEGWGKGNVNMLYLPINYRSGRNSGYAFVNLKSKSTTEDFSKFYSLHYFFSKSYSVPPSASPEQVKRFKSLESLLKNHYRVEREPVSVKWARVQGLEENLGHFRSSPVGSMDDHLRPLVYSEGKGLQPMARAGPRREGIRGAPLHGSQAARSSGGRPSDRRVFVGGLAKSTTDRKIREYVGSFGVHGEKVAITLALDKQSGQSKGFAFIEFKNPEDARAFVDAPEHMIDGKSIAVRWYIDTPAPSERDDESVGRSRRRCGSSSSPDSLGSAISTRSRTLRNGRRAHFGGEQDCSLSFLNLTDGGSVLPAVKEKSTASTVTDPDLAALIRILKGTDQAQVPSKSALFGGSSKLGPQLPSFPRAAVSEDALVDREAWTLPGIPEGETVYQPFYPSLQAPAVCMSEDPPLSVSLIPVPEAQSTPCIERAGRGRTELDLPFLLTALILENPEAAAAALAMQGLVKEEYTS